MVITVTLFGLVIMLLFNLYPGSISALKHAECLFESSNLAQSLLANMKEGPFAGFDTPPAPGDSLGAHGTIYHCIYAPLPLTGVDTNYLKGVRVTVGWEERNRSYSVTKELIVSKIQK
jgi:hypothetical protein